MADTVAPVLVSLAFPASIDFATTKTIHFSATATDEGGSGVSYVFVDFDQPLVLTPSVDPGNLATYGFEFLFPTSGVAAATDLGNTSAIGPYSRPGTYHISFVNVTDNAGNTRYYEPAELAKLGIPTSLTVTGTTADLVAPQLKSLNLPAVIDERTAPAPFTLTATASDNLAGIDNMFIHLDNGVSLETVPDKIETLAPTSVIFLFNGFEEYWTNGQYTYKSAIDAPGGVYNVDYIDLTDKAGNTAHYTDIDLGRMGINTSMVVDDGVFHPTKLSQQITVEPRTAGQSGEIVVKLSADHWKAGVNTFSATFSVDPKVASFDGWHAGAAGSYDVQTSVVTDATTGKVVLTANIDDGNQGLDFLELRFKPSVDIGTFALGVSGAHLNGVSLQNDFSTKTDFIVTFPQTGTAGDDLMSGTAAIDVLQGLGGNDVFTNLHGSDSVDGGAGLDTVRYSGKLADYDVEHDGAALTVMALSGLDGRQHLANVERIAFADQTLAFDAGAAQVARLYQAAFDRKPDAAGLGFWINAMDHGASLSAVARAFEASDEFHHLYGVNPSTVQLVADFYNNVLHRVGDAAGVAFWIDAIDHRGASTWDVLVQFSESPENQAQVAALVGNGVAFVPMGA